MRMIIIQKLFAVSILWQFRLSISHARIPIFHSPENYIRKNTSLRFAFCVFTRYFINTFINYILHLESRKMFQHAIQQKVFV